MSKDTEYNIIAAWRQAIVLSARARRRQSDVGMDPLIAESLKAQISQSHWHRDMRSITGTLCSNHGEPSIPGLTLEPQLSEKPERETKVRVLSNHNFAYHENIDEFLNDARLLRAISHAELEALVKMSKNTRKRMEEGIEKEKFFDVADFIGNSTNYQN
ncbi:uncharacterized protein L199_000221 [Kwoniella botswanensis]|uniref:uncharacterized protein n=1 Tax=Kwoniella botswanensis TaxID=1268659 RepID=UPI00315D6849